MKRDNLLKRVKKQFETLERFYDEYVDDIKQRLEITREHLKNLNDKLYFSDDEDIEELIQLEKSINRFIKEINDTDWIEMVRNMLKVSLDSIDNFEKSYLTKERK